MKNFILKIVASAICLNVTLLSYAQNWSLGGNTDAAPPPSGLLSNSNYFGGTQTASVRLGTGGVSRIFIGGTTFANPGFIGMGNNFLNPQFRLHLSGDGGILSSGNTFGVGVNIPLGLNGPLFIWSPKKASFRAGEDNIGAWSDVNTGNYSVAFGQDNEASGNYSVSWGQNNIVSGNQSLGIGFTNNVLGNRSYVMGDQNQINANSSFCNGSNNIMDGGGFISGNSNSITNTGSGWIFGTQNLPMTGSNNFLFGIQNMVDGRSSFTFGEANNVTSLSTGFSVTMGQGNTNNSNNSYAFGIFNQTDAQKSFALGERVRTTLAATNSFAFGKGFNSTNPFTNNIANTFMVGFNSDVSTFTVVSPVTSGIGATGRVGIANSNPQNTLEITSNTAIPSGLRFTNLLSTATPVANPGTGVLSIDANGDVIYVDAPAGTGIGNFCGQPQMPLTNDFEIPLDNFSYNFTAQPGSNDLSRVNMGNLLCGTTFPARLYVREAEPMPGAPFHTAITGETDGNLLANLAPVYGSAGILYNSRALGFTNHAGVIGISISANNDIFTAQTIGIGVVGTALQNDNNIGVVGIATNNGVNANIGIYGEASGATGINRAGYFNGDLEYTGALIPSDQSLKTNINTIENADSLLSLLSPKTFEYDIPNTPQFNFPSGEQMGVIAQDVETVLPQLVKEGYRPAKYDSLGNLVYSEIFYKSVNYEAFIPLLIAGHKEQAEKLNEKDSLINALQDQINTLYGMITACCSSNSGMVGTGVSINSTTGQQSLDVTLTDAPSIVLDQNVPNPFAEQTTITYSLVEGVQKAQMLFYNIEGKLIQSVNLVPTNGKGQINVFANDLSTGIYTYTLVVDGEIKGTKRMVKN